MFPDTLLAWLLDGDPAIRWQTWRDLLGEPPEAYEPDRARVSLTEGWGARLLARQIGPEPGRTRFTPRSGLRPPTRCCCCAAWACGQKILKRGRAVSCC